MSNLNWEIKVCLRVWSWSMCKQTKLSPLRVLHFYNSVHSLCQTMVINLWVQKALNMMMQLNFNIDMTSKIPLYWMYFITVTWRWEMRVWTYSDTVPTIIKSITLAIHTKGTLIDHKYLKSVSLRVMANQTWY